MTTTDRSAAGAYAEHEFPNGLRFKTRLGTSDYNTLRACAYEDEYELEDIFRSSSKPLLVFDIGAHIGGVAILAASLGHDAVAVEPIPENAQLIRENAELNEVQVAVEEAAIGEPPKLLLRYMWNSPNSLPLENEVAKIHSYIGNTGLGRAGFPADKEVWVPAITLSKLVEKYGAPDIIKTDCEGGEWQLFEDPAVRQVPLIVGEWHEMNHGYTLGDFGEWVTTEEGYRREQIIELIDETHEVTFSGPESGAGGFRAVLQ